MPYYLFNAYTRERINEHSILDVLQRRPNELMGPALYRKLRQTHRLLNGNSYVYIARSSRTGRVEELIPLPPDFVSRCYDAERQLHYIFTDPKSGDQFDLLPYQVLDRKAFTLDGITGITPLKYARDVVGKDLAAKQYERALYQNGGRPSGILYTDSDLSGMSREIDKDGKPISKKEVIRQAWNRVHGTAEGAFRTAVLDLGLKYQAVSMNNTDAQYIESSDMTVADIGRLYGVPLHALMSGKQSYESNMQNRTEFVQTTGLAIVTEDEEEDTYKLLSASDWKKHLRIKLNMDAALRGDTASRDSHYREQFFLGGMSVNEIRAKEDMPDVEGGDLRIASLNYVPLENFREISLARNTQPTTEPKEGARDV